MVGWCAVVEYSAVIDGAFPAVGLFVVGVWWAASVVGVMIVGERVIGLWVASSQICPRVVWIAGDVFGTPILFCVDGLLLGDAASCEAPRCFLLGYNLPPVCPVHAINVRADSKIVGVSDGVDGSCSN